MPSASLRSALALGLLPMACFAQATFPLAGAVTNAITGEPVARARVVATRFSGTGETREITFTDQAGAFRFPSLPAGQYSLRAQKPRFKPKDIYPGPPIDLTAPLENISLPITPFSVIAGQVTDTDGQPLRYVRVDAYRQDVVLGLHHHTRAGTAATDDRGNFRIWNLPAGRYFVRAMSRSGGTFSLADESAPSTVGRRAFAPVYAGGFERLAEATPTDLSPGQLSRADFRLAHLPAFRIRGRVTGLAPGVPARFELRRTDTEPTEPRTFFNPATGVFTIFDLLPGDYQIRVRQGEGPATLTAEALAKAGPDETAPVVLTAHPPTILTLRMEGPGDYPCNGLLVDGDRPLWPAALLDADQPANVPAGSYHLRLNCAMSAVESIRFGQTELRESLLLTVPAGAAPSNLTVTRSARSGRLVIVRQGESAGLPVVLLPGDGALGPPRLLEEFELSQHGIPLLPGAYSLHAIRDRQAPFRDPVFLRQLGQGSPVRIEDGQTTQVVIGKLSPP